MFCGRNQNQIKCKKKLEFWNIQAVYSKYIMVLLKYFCCSNCTNYNTYTHDLLNKLLLSSHIPKLKTETHLNTNHWRLYRNLQFLPNLRIGLKWPAYLKRINERRSCRFLRRCLRLRLRNLRLLRLSLLRLRLRLCRRLKRRLLRIRLLRPRCPVIKNISSMS